jgi:DNA-binding transcriptional ArsR family regulator
MRTPISVQKEDLFTMPKASLIKILKTLSSPRRLDILVYLYANKHAHVNELADVFSASIQSTSHHLRILKFCYLVKSEQQGKFVAYQLNRPLPRIVQMIIRKHYKNS